MKKRAALSAFLLALVCLSIRGYSQSSSISFSLLDRPNGAVNYTLNVVVPQSLYEYYRDRSHRIISNDDFAKFVTPYPLQPIADCLLEIYEDPEDFTNGVLMIVHQIPYSETAPAKYPVETIEENEGDCDLFSYVAASILKAGGLDVILLYYERETHMNIGVCLPQPPHDARQEAYFVTNEGTTYYVAECTGDDWRNGWRVGECPDDLQHASVQIITLEDSEEWSPGQVSASYRSLVSSSLSLELTPLFTVQGGTVTISGQLSPSLENETITIYVSNGNSPWNVLNRTFTDNYGRYLLVWKAEDSGMYYLRASWSGDGDYAGADSRIHNVIVVSMFLVFLSTAVVFLACIGLISYLITRKSAQEEIEEPQPPIIPS